jgi:L-threonylcarbamoyladenylate synthase
VSEDLIRAAEVLAGGGTILYPTDTIWGLGCDATNSAAVERIFAIKKRPDAKSMIILVDSEKMLFQYAGDFPDVALDILRISDNPLTIIFPDAHGIAPGLIAEDGSAGIRLTRDKFCTDLIRKIGRPIVSTSANISGLPWPQTFKNIDREIRDSVDYVVKWRQDERSPGKPSGIIKVWPDGKIKVIRE